MDIVEEGKSGMSRECSFDIYTLICVKQMAGEKLLYNMEDPSCHAVMT